MARTSHTVRNVESAHVHTQEAWGILLALWVFSLFGASLEWGRPGALGVFGLGLVSIVAYVGWREHERYIENKHRRSVERLESEAKVAKENRLSGASLEGPKGGKVWLREISVMPSTRHLITKKELGSPSLLTRESKALLPPTDKEEDE